MLMQGDLPHDWPHDPDLRERIVHWSWFEPAFRNALEQACTHHSVRTHLHDDSLCQAFFAWVHELERHHKLETHDALDFRHVMAGLLLQQLLAAQLHVTGADRLLALHNSGNTDPTDSAATLITQFVLGLLQALRQQAGAPALSIDATLAQYWNSYLENVAQDPAMAICYLDRMTGLEPVWDTPTLIGARPAMRAAMASSNMV